MCATLRAWVSPYNRRSSASTSPSESTRASHGPLRESCPGAHVHALLRALYVRHLARISQAIETA
jgi:hypothetical protein